MTWARRTDGNQAAIFATLRAVGWRVHDTSRLPGFVDGIAWHPGRQRFAMIECKLPKTGILTAAQIKLVDAGWPVKIVRTPQEAERL